MIANSKHHQVELNCLPARNHLNRAMVDVEPTLVHHVGAKMVMIGVKLASVTNWLQSMVTQARYKQHAEASYLR